MSLFSFVIWIVIIFSIINNVKKKQGQAKPSAKPNEPRRQTPDYQPQQVTPRPAAAQAQRQPVKQPAKSSVRPAAAAQTKAVAAGAAPQKEKSTTELLREKAMQDEMEHRREKQQQERENELHHGRIRYAERLVEGDPVPAGKRRIVCAYCNADNLVPVHDFSTKYNCYFCRETL